MLLTFLVFHLKLLLKPLKPLDLKLLLLQLKPQLLALNVLHHNCTKEVVRGGLRRPYNQNVF